MAFQDFRCDKDIQGRQIGIIQAFFDYQSTSFDFIFLVIFKSLKESVKDSKDEIPFPTARFKDFFG
jgi:hypothetical protein